MRLCVLLRSAKLTTIGNRKNISFLTAVVSTSTRMHGEFLRLLFLQAHRETEAHFIATGMPSQRNQPDSFRFKRAAFYQSLKSKVGLATADGQAVALRINRKVEGSARGSVQGRCDYTDAWAAASPTLLFSDW